MEVPGVALGCVRSGLLCRCHQPGGDIVVHPCQGQHGDGTEPRPIDVRRLLSTGEVLRRFADDRTAAARIRTASLNPDVLSHFSVPGGAALVGRADRRTERPAMIAAIKPMMEWIAPDMMPTASFAVTKIVFETIERRAVFSSSTLP